MRRIYSSTRSSGGITREERRMNDWAVARLSGHLEARGGEGLFWMTLAVLVAVLVVSLL